MISRCLAFFILFSTLGCTTVEFVRKDTTPRKQAVVRHQPTSDVEKAAKYRAEVAKKAKDFCDGDFDITKEYQAREVTGTSTGVSTGIGIGFGGLLLGGSTANTAMYNFVEFSCR